jgi:SHS2 domain-containing protein
MYETFDHTADIGLRITAPTLAELFAESGKALASLIVANLVDVQPVEERLITVAGDEKDYLFFDWLNELLYVLDRERLIFSEFEVTLSDVGLTARCRGEQLDSARHRLEHEVKAITYHGLIVEQTENGWLAEVILDI